MSDGHIISVRKIKNFNHKNYVNDCIVLERSNTYQLRGEFNISVLKIIDWKLIANKTTHKTE